MPIQPPNDKQRRDTAARNLMNKLHDATLPVEDWKFTLRASGIPICQWHACLATVYEKAPEERPPETTSFRFDYYVSVGTAVHTVYQRWLGRMGVLYGHFKCLVCGNLEEDRLGWPDVCTKGCKNPTWEYVELELQNIIPGSPLKSAHTDGLLHFPWQEPNHYFLIDFKTCSLATLPDPKQRFTNPYHMKYLTQTGFYHYLLERRGLRIDGTGFWMIPRDQPAKAVIVWYNQSSMAERMYQTVIQDYEEAMAAAKMGDMSGIVKACSTAHDKPDCPFNEICFSRGGNEILKKLFLKTHGRLPILP